MSFDVKNCFVAICWAPLACGSLAGQQFFYRIVAIAIALGSFSCFSIFLGSLGKSTSNSNPWRPCKFHRVISIQLHWYYPSWPKIIFITSNKSFSSCFFTLSHSNLTSIDSLEFKFKFSTSFMYRMLHM